MNSEKISERQLFYLITLELFSIVTLFLPEFLSSYLRQDAPVGLLLGFIFAFLFACLLKTFFGKYGNILLLKLEKKSILLDLLSFAFFIQMLLFTILLINICCEIVQQFLLFDTNTLPIYLSFYIVCVFASIGQLETRARMAEFIGRFFAIVFIILLIFATRRVDLNQYESLFMNSGKKILNGGYEVFLFLLSIIFSLFAAGSLSDKNAIKGKNGKKYISIAKSYGNAVKKSLLAGFIFSLVLIMILIGTFGTNYIGQMQYSAIRLLRNITQQGGFLSRMDVLMIGVWIFSMFFFVSGGLQYGRSLLCSFLNGNSEKAVSAVLYIVVFVIAVFLGNRENSYYLYRNYSYYIGTPLIVLLLLLLILLPFARKERSDISSDEKEVRHKGISLCLKKQDNKEVIKLKSSNSYWFIGFIIILGIFIFSYDRGETLEEKDYIMAMRFDLADGKREITYESPQLKKDEAQSVLDNKQKISKTENKYYEDFVSVYNSENASEIDLQHLKVLIIGKNILSSDEEFSIFLKFLKEQKEFAENIYIVVDGSEDGLLVESENSVGSYLENLLDKRNKKQPQMSTTAGKLLASTYNKNQTIFIPVISENREIIGEWTVACGKAFEFIEEEEASWYLAANAINCGSEIHYKDIYGEALDEKQNFSIEISKISRQVSFRQKDGKVYADVIVNIKGLGKDYSGKKLPDNSKKYDKEEALSLCLTEKMQGLSKKKEGKDYFNTFYEMSNKNRGLWKKYKDSYEEYMKNVVVDITVSVEFES